MKWSAVELRNESCKFRHFYRTLFLTWSFRFDAISWNFCHVVLLYAWPRLIHRSLAPLIHASKISSLGVSVLCQSRNAILHAAFKTNLSKRQLCTRTMWVGPNTRVMCKIMNLTYFCVQLDSRKSCVKNALRKKARCKTTGREGQQCLSWLGYPLLLPSSVYQVWPLTQFFSVSFL